MLSLEVNEFIERIDEMLRLVEEEGETIDILQCGEVVASIVPAQYQAQTAIWTNIETLAAEMGIDLQEEIDAIDIIRDAR